ncbi:uncharacterized protein LOC143855964 [Tasmannia lanceolata]|uniref:uncharacterized protein LOC143855964 n=1 Tax=Tasmannia lanceolata TaxID=3420 RepID=UPI0040630828
MIGGDVLILDPESLITPAEGPLTNWSSQVIPQVVIQYSPVSIKESIVSSYMSISESKIEFAISDVSFDAGTVVIEPVDEESFDAVFRSDAESVASSVESTESVKSAHTIVQSDEESVKSSKDFNTDPIEAMGCMLAQQDPESKRERAIYYVSKKMLEYEQKYTILEKTCLALVWATQKLRHYLLSNRVLLLSRMDPLKYLFEKPALTGKTARWLLLLSKFDITYITQKSIKGRVIAEQLADSLAENNEFLKAEFPDEEIMTVEDEFKCTNNMAEYEACIAGLEAAMALHIQDLDVFGDSILIICQTNGNWKTRDDKLILYNTYLESLVRKFRNITFTHLSRTKNHFAHALATLASMLDISATMEVQPLEVRLQWAPTHVNAIEIAARCSYGKPWYTDIKNLILGKGHPPEFSGKERRSLQKLAVNFVICGEELYRRSFDGIQLLCIDEDQAAELIEQTHEGLHSLTSPWPFSVWGIDIIGKISLKPSSGHEYILIAIDYFTKWIEAASYASLTSAFVARTSIKSSTGATPYSLVYGMEAVLPVELRIPSLRDDGSWVARICLGSSQISRVTND